MTSSDASNANSAPITVKLEQQPPQIVHNANVKVPVGVGLQRSSVKNAPLQQASTGIANSSSSVPLPAPPATTRTATSVPSPVPVSIPSPVIESAVSVSRQQQQTNKTVAVPAPLPISYTQHQHVSAPPSQQNTTSRMLQPQSQILQHSGNPANSRAIGKVPASTVRRPVHAQITSQQSTISTAATIIASNLRVKSQHSSTTAATNTSAQCASIKQSKKKKATVTMATAQTATPASTQGENTGRWTAEEHRLFLQGLEEHGKGWKKIASLIKSRTVVQIRTHAQKYFQKLAKARQNGEEGDVSMENRERSSMSTSSKRRRSGTKRKAISSVVASAEREGKRRAEAASKSKTATTDEGLQDGKAQGAPTHPSDTQNSVNLPTVAPALTPYVYHIQQQKLTSTTTSNPSYQHLQQFSNYQSVTSSPSFVPSITTPTGGTISGAELEQSLFRFLTPNPNEPMDDANGNLSNYVSTQVNDIARQAGANPITVPTLPVDKTHSNNFVGGDVSPTGVTDINSFPSSWLLQNVEPPSWYTKGTDVDELLNEAEALDWLADSGDFDEDYTPPAEDLLQNQDQNQGIVFTQVPTSQLSEPSLLSLGADNSIKVKTEENPGDNFHSHNHTTSDIVHHQVQAFVADIGQVVPKTFSNNEIKGISPTPSALNIPPLPSFFESSSDLKPMKKSNTKPSLNNLSSVSLFASATEAADAVGSGDSFLDTQFVDEQAFVTALLDHQ